MDDAQPLIYVDGVMMGGGEYASAKEALAEISPDDIERIEVIKGAKARDTYGEEARNGVILIFTKK
jgi:TonB-dependent SusC/RagA subfamily outer membrane receptor